MTVGIRKRLQTIAEVILPESQCWFRPSRSTVDMVLIFATTTGKSSWTTTKPLHDLHWFVKSFWHSGQLKIYGTPLKSVKNFTYLGSTVAPDNTIDVEINNRIHAASGACGGLWERVWSQHGIAVSTKCKVYKEIVLPRLLCSADTYTLYTLHIRKPSQMHLRHPHGKTTSQMLLKSWDGLICSA